MPNQSTMHVEQSDADAPVELVAVLENGGVISDNSDAEVEFVGEWRVPSTNASFMLVGSETTSFQAAPVDGLRNEQSSPQPSVQSGSRRRRPAEQASALRALSNGQPRRTLQQSQRRRNSVYERIHRRLREMAGNRREPLAGRQGDRLSLTAGHSPLLESLEPFLAAEGWSLESLAALPLASEAFHPTSEMGWVLSSSPSRTDPNRRTPSRRPGRRSRRPRGASGQPHWAVAMLNSFLQPSFDSMPSPSPNPCSRALVELLPVQNATEREQTETCPICLSSYHEGERLRRLPCLHLFHRSCIDRWLSKQDSCPVDKMKVADGFTDEFARTKLLALGVNDERTSSGAAGVQQRSASDAASAEATVPNQVGRRRRRHPGRSTRQRHANVMDE
ncbi:hypothetical protein F1559_004796 [Cyanidiococcus yangmingshanensis]|uniref:RING-type domain-containing protein n=1 Tax=Cyanidiococcus yangmingshanensis TaxID=2690220 RepID=A0A7J7IQI7_9RHOD|nr:hypothetical protein F1559_004796 [Cyanidiococcus yangmingshanensis]